MACNAQGQESLSSNDTAPIKKSAGTHREPKVHWVSLSQWVSANSQIMAWLFELEEIADQGDILDYLEYMVHIGDLVQNLHYKV